MRCVATVAAYRERWGIDTDLDPSGRQTDPRRQNSSASERGLKPPLGGHSSYRGGRT